MNTSLNWIKAYVPGLDCTDQEYRDRMTMSGTKVENFNRLDRNLKNIAVGQILSIEKHPDAEKLIVCQVDVGEEHGGRVQIVTGAHNVSEGDKVPVVLDGGRVAGGHDGGPLPENGIDIRAGKLRGIESAGMMCAIEELGSSREVFPDAPEDGIYILDKDCEVGADAVELLGLKDTIFEYEITSNRVDCYSVLGIAREAAATFGLDFVPPAVPETGQDSEKSAAELIDVAIEDQDLCSRYVARIADNITIGESPRWMKERLRSAGIRPISNLVDITNYVMLEYGQPMHAYDLSTLKGGRIVVRRANDGDVFVTLDGNERKLDHDVLMICDGEKEIGIAGIMGGENSMITEGVHTVLFEAACFNGANIRKSSRRVGLRTDASGIFEKGLDPHNALAAMNRACALVEELCCGRVLKGCVDIHSPLPEKRRIAFESDRINRYLGTDIPAADMLGYFKRLEIEYDEASGELVCPTFRQDLLGFADIAEEAARFYGYDKIPLTLPKSGAGAGKLSFKLEVEKAARESAALYGFSEGMCYSFESPRVFDMLLMKEDAPERQAIKIANPLGEDFSIMRTISLNGILGSLATNMHHRNKNVRLYELGNIYIPKSLPLEELPDERMQFTLGAYGDVDFFVMKAVVEEFLENAGLADRKTYDPTDKKSYLHPQRQADIFYGKDRLGYIGEVHPLVCKNYDMNERVYVAVLDMKTITSMASFSRKYRGLARFPAVSRDLSMVVPAAMPVGDIEKVFAIRGGKILEDYSLFDIYQGEQIKSGYKSVAYTLTFRDKEKTLSDDDVQKVMKKILNGLGGMGIELRS